MKKRLFSALLCILLGLTMIAPVGAASSASEISERLQQISQTTGYTAGSFWGAGGCWRFANAVSQKLFGVNIPTGTNGQYYLTGAANNPNWDSLGTCRGGSGANRNISDLLKKAQPGDIMQYRSSVTSTTTASGQKIYQQHTAVVYAVSDYGISIYDHASSVQIRTSAWSQLFSWNGGNGIGSFESALSNSGLSLYRCNRSILTGSLTQNQNSNSSGIARVNVTTGEADAVTETSAILRGAFQVTGARASECGMYLGTSDGNMTKLGSDPVNTAGTSMFYSTAKYGRPLEAGTTYSYKAYVIAGGKEVCGITRSFTTKGAAVLPEIPEEPPVIPEEPPVVPEEPPKITGDITLSQRRATLAPGDRLSLTAATTPSGQAVSWRSTDPAVAAVADGIVTAVRPGTATVNATMEYDGAQYFALCTVTVREPEPVVQVTDRGATALTQTSARVQASCSYSEGSRPTSVGLYLGTAPSSLSFYDSDSGINHNKNPFDIWYDLNGLAAGTTYYYKFYAVTERGQVWSAVSSFTTEQPAAAPDTTPAAVVVNTNGQYLAINDAPAASPKYSTQIGRIPPGGTVRVYPDRTSGNWYYVEYDGVSGYAYNKFLSLQ